MKRSFTLFTALLTLLAMLSFTAFADDGEIVVGDVDGDGEVTFEDYIITRLLASADTNSDGVIDESDYTAILDYITSGISMPEHEHSIVIDAAVEPTCLEPGFTAGAHCSACGKVIVAQQKIPSKDHTVVIVDGVKPTCISDGVSSWAYCSDCGKVLVSQKTLPASGHAYGTPTYTWNDKKCTASVICANDESHVLTETVTGVYVKDTDATYTADEKGHYEAVFADSHFAKRSTPKNGVVKYGTRLEDPNYDPEAPGTYLWVKTEDPNNCTTINFIFTPDDIRGGLGTYRIFADIKFEDVVQRYDGGAAYVNLYFWDEAGNLIDGGWTDWAEHNTEGVEQGKWANMDYEFTCPDGFAYATVGIGCWEATGTVSIGTINISENKEMIWNVSFAGGLDLESEQIKGTTNISLDNEEINWGVVRPATEDTGKVNLAFGKEVFIYGGFLEGNEQEAAYQAGQFKGELTDGIIADASFVPEYFGFHTRTNVDNGGELNGMTGDLGRIMIDLGEEKEFDEVRLFYYGPLDHNGGIGHCDGMAAFYSNDGENWEKFGDLIYDTEADIGWGDTGSLTPVTARYVLVEYLYNGGSWGMVAEVEILAPEYIDDPEEPGNHTYSEPVYNWNNDTCTALRVCLDDSSLSVIETVVGVYVKDTNATYTADETGHYEASFKSPLFTRQSTAKGSVVKYGTMLEPNYDPDAPESYFWMKGMYTGNADTDVQPGITWVISNESGIFENGKTYTAYANAKFDESCTGTVYCNVYVYNDYEKACAFDWTGLMNFNDFAKCGSIDGVWNEFSDSWVFSDHSYGSKVLSNETIGGVTFGIGFWQASGKISVSEIGIKDENGNVIWSKTFESGLDLTADDICGNYLVVGDEGISWGVVGAKTHTYSDPVYSWNNDTCTALRVCLDDSSHSVIETVTGVYVKDTNATYTADETGHYEASFKSPLFTKQSTAKGSVVKYGTMLDEAEYDPVEKGENIALGKSYTIENYTVRTDGYGDHDYVKLTDGVKDDNGGIAPAGFNFAEGADSASIIIDLGGEAKIAAILTDIQGGNWGLPDSNTYSVSFAVSTDGGTYLYLGTINGSDADVIKTSTDDSRWNVTNYECSCFTDARYVKVTYNKPNGYTGNHIWPSEIMIFERNDGTYSEPVYNWNNDTCTALRVCLDDSSLSVIETVVGVYVKDTNATYTADETGHYEASFKSPLFTKQSTAKGSVVRYGTMLDESAGSEGLCYTSNGDGTCSVSKGDCTDTEIVIPPVSPAGDIVTEIDSFAFDYCSNLTSVVIPDSVTYIGERAFFNCIGLTSIVIPDSVTYIDYRAFDYCSNLTSIVIPNSVTYIGDGAFEGCSGLTSVVIGNSVTYIGDMAFWNCSGLTSIVIPDSVTEIGSGAFAGCSGLENIDVKKGNLIYHNDGNCIIETDSKILLCGCKNSVIPDDGSVTEIGYNAFFGCSSLTSIVIPDSVTYIGDMAFYGCSNLTSIVIPDSVTRIGYAVFSGCSGLKRVEVKEGNPVYHSDGNCIIETASKMLLYGFKNSVIPEDGSVTEIGGSAFSDCSSLTSIVIPDSVTKIGDWAFSECYSLTSIVIPDSVTEIGSYAFYYCSGLTSIVIPDSVTYIGDCAFEYCSGLTSVVIGNSVTEIGSGEFWDCSGLSSVVIGNSVTEIGSGAFSNCSSLTSIVIPDSVTKIGYNAFEYCSSLTSIVIPDSVTYIGDWAFSECYSLTSIVIPDSVAYIDSYAFYGCTNLEDVYYSGTSTQWRNISIGDNNGSLKNAEIHFNS